MFPSLRRKINGVGENSIEWKIFIMENITGAGCSKMSKKLLVVQFLTLQIIKANDICERSITLIFNRGSGILGLILFFHMENSLWNRQSISY